MTAQSMLFAVWANNRGGDAGDSVADVRTHRATDTALAAAKWDRVQAAVAADERTEEEVEAGILALLGLTQ